MFDTFLISETFGNLVDSVLPRGKGGRSNPNPFPEVLQQEQDGRVRQQPDGGGEGGGGT